MIYRYIYKITCTTGSFKDKFYFGQHTTENLNDGYKGSGTKLKNYYKKHPDDYIKEIIAFYNNNEELNKAEYDIIHPYLNDKMCLNLKDGGNNVKYTEELKQKIATSLKGHKVSDITKSKISKSGIGHTPWNKGKKGEYYMSEETRKKVSESMKGKNTWMKGRKCSEETLRKRSISLKGKLKGRVFSEETRKKMSESAKNRKKKITIL